MKFQACKGSKGHASHVQTQTSEDHELLMERDKNSALQLHCQNKPCLQRRQDAQSTQKSVTKVKDLWDVDKHHGDMGPISKRCLQA